MTRGLEADRIRGTDRPASIALDVTGAIPEALDRLDPVGGFAFLARTHPPGPEEGHSPRELAATYSKARAVAHASRA